MARKKRQGRNETLDDLQQNEDERRRIQPLLKTTSEAAERSSSNPANVLRRLDERKAVGVESRNCEPFQPRPLRPPVVFKPRDIFQCSSTGTCRIMVIRAYGLSFGCLASTHQAPYRIVDPNSCPAPRCRAERLSPAVAAPGSCLPGAPIVWDTRPIWVRHKGSHRAFGKGVQRAVTMRILTRFTNRRLEDYAKKAL